MVKFSVYLNSLIFVMCNGNFTFKRSAGPNPVFSTHLYSNTVPAKYNCSPYIGGYVTLQKLETFEMVYRPGS